MTYDDQPRPQASSFALARDRETFLGPTETFTCAPYIGRAAVDAVPYQPHALNGRHFHEPITEAIYFGPTAVSNANTAMQGLHRLILDRSIKRVTVLETGLGEDWNAQSVQALRTAIFTIAGSRFMQPNQPTQAVRNDILAGEPNGTIIVKGQANKLPLFVVEKEIQPGVRRIDVLNGQITEMDAVMCEVNAFSPNERRLAGIYLGMRTSDPTIKSSVMAHANRYTTPNPDMLHGAFQSELYKLRQEEAQPGAWAEQMNAYEARKEQIPE